MKARFSISWCNDGGNKAAAVKLMRKLLKKQGFAPDVLVTDNCALTARPSRRWDCRLAMSRACGTTIGPRIRISRRDDANARCSGSNRLDQPNGSCPFMAPSIARSTSSAISRPATRSASSETTRSGRGEPRRQHEPELRLPDFESQIQVPVTTPSSLLDQSFHDDGLAPISHRNAETMVQ